MSKSRKLHLIPSCRPARASAFGSSLHYYLIDDFGTTRVVVTGVPDELRSFFEANGFLPESEKSTLSVPGGRRTVERLFKKEELSRHSVTVGGRHWRGFYNLAEQTL